MKALFTFIILSFAIAVKAAPPDFLVYYAKGAATKKGAKNNAFLKKGDALSKNDVLLMTSGAEVILLCPNYNTIQLKKAGAVSLKDLNQCSQTPASATSSYFHYIWDELLTHHGDPEKNPSHYMRNKGAVSRGCTMVMTGVNADTIYYQSGTLPISWKTTYPVPYISFFPDDRDNAPTHKEPLIKKPLQLDQYQSVLKEKGDYYWQITDEYGNACTKNYLKVLSKTDYTQRVNTLLKTVVVSTPAETALMSGYLLEENHFLAEALAYYTKAQKLDPKNSLINKAYIRFYEIK